MTVVEAAAAPARAQQQATARARRKTAPPAWVYWISPFAILVLWFIGSATGILAASVLPSPLRVITAAFELTANGTLPEAVLTSLARVASGTAIGFCAGLVLGIVSSYSRIGEAVVDRPLQMLRAIPFNALLPLFIIAFGIGEGMKVLLIAVGVLVPIYLNTAAGVRGVDPKLFELARVYRYPRRIVAFHVLFLGALPAVLTGLRFALAIAWIALVTSETVNTNAGIGFLLTQAQRFVRPEIVLLCIIMYALLGVITDWIVRLLERRLLRWRPSLLGE